MAKDIKISEVVVVDGKPLVRGSVGEVLFEAATKQWGSKMLMNVAAEGLDRGTRIAIGHAAKRAVKAAQMVLPEAVLKRPRKAKSAPAVVVAAPVIAAVEGGVELEGGLSLESLDELAGTSSGVVVAARVEAV